MLDRLDALISSGRETTEQLHPGTLIRVPLDESIRTLEEGPARPSYSYVAPALARQLASLGDRGSALSSAYHQLLLLVLIQRRAPIVAAASDLTDTIKAWYLKNFNRIVSDAAAGRAAAAFHHYTVDAYLKDLGVCCGRIIPAGAQKLNRYDLPVRGLRHEGPGRLVQAARCIARMGGLAPVFDMHTDSHDPDLLAEFTPEGWRRFYLAVAGLLELQPDVRGLYGIGWFFDPQLARVSPRLDYLRELVAESGGHLFRIGPSQGARDSALATSPTRRSLHAEGRYEPTDYMALWDRRALLRWSTLAEAHARPSTGA